MQEEFRYIEKRHGIKEGKPSTFTLSRSSRVSKINANPKTEI